MGAPTVHLSRENMEKFHMYPFGWRKASRTVNGILEGFYFLVCKRKQQIRELFTTDELLLLAANYNENFYYPGGLDDTIERLAGLLAGLENKGISTKGIESKIDKLDDVAKWALIEFLADFREENDG